MADKKDTEDDLEPSKSVQDGAERDEVAGSPKEPEDATLEHPSAEGEGSIRNQPMEEGEVAGRTSVEAERIATGKQTEEIEHEAADVADDATLLPSPMHLDLPPIDTSDLGHGPESPTTSLVQSLRDQLTQLHDQSQLLNTKLVASISRHADLEDQHVHLQHQHKELQERSEVLEQEKSRWEESMNTGLLVERAQIKDEMQKLAAGLVEEERRRGSAEERRIKVENEVDDLAASLFNQANTMVAFERMHRTNAETRLKETEENLAAAESAMRDMQLHLQSLPSSANPQVLSPPPTAFSRRLLGSHVPYSEFLTFLSHLRALRPLRATMFPPPIITNLVAQPFIARAMIEDQDPTLRLDAAPTISYFSRRTVTNAAIAGDLVIEPVPVATLLTGTTSIHDLNCSLCGQAIFSTSTPGQPQSPSGSQFGPPPAHPTHRSSSRFSLKPFFATPSPSATPSEAPESPLHGTSMTVHVFRIAKPVQPTTGTEEKAEKAKIYPLCKTGWCLQRLRATCELWYFVRMGIIHAVWHGDDGYVLSSERPAPVERTSSPVLEVPDQQVERKKSSWGLGFKLSEKSSWRTPFKAAESDPPSPKTRDKGLEPDEATPDAADVDGDTAERPQVDTEKLNLPSITKQEPSPVKKRESEDDKPPALDRKDSNLSTTSKDSDDGFHTPANEEEDEVNPETPKAVEDTETRSPRRSGSVSPRPRGPRERPGSASGEKRKSLSVETGATLSPRTSRELKDRSESVEEAIEDDDDKDEAVDDHDESAVNGDKEDEEAADEKKEAAQGDEEELAQAAEAEKEEGERSAEKQIVDLTNDAKPASPAPPRLPPRLPPRKPQRASTDSETLATNAKWLDPNSGAWEIKTWKMVVKLKEDMWKARVGVEQV